MATVLYPNPATRRIIESAITQGKVVLWLYDSSKSLFFNPGITSGSIAGAMATPADGGDALAPDFIVRGGTDGFATAARTAGLYRGNGLSSETEDDAAARIFFTGVKFSRDSFISG
jgi:hypothetical protein